MDIKTVQIGNKLWMAENLAYDDGGDGITYNPENKEYYYTWDTTKRVANKLGWMIPSEEDWNKACEECGGIKDNEGDYNNCSLKEKLNIKLAGYYCNDFYNVGSNGHFWSSFEGFISTAWHRDFDSNSLVTRNYDIENYRLSVRLMKEK